MTSHEQQCTTKRAATKRIESRKQLHEGGRAPGQLFPMLAFIISMATKQDSSIALLRISSLHEKFTQRSHSVNGSISDQRSAVVLSLASRADETAAAIRLLLLHKHPLIDDTGTWLRTLIEHGIDAGFIAASDRSFAGKYVAHEDLETAKHDERRRLEFPEMRAAGTPEPSLSVLGFTPA